MTDTFRKNYKTLRAENQGLIRAIKEAAEYLESLMQSITSREMSLAMTNLEQCTMWATKAIVLHDEKETSPC
jgi:hypothetical protein